MSGVKGFMKSFDVRLLGLALLVPLVHSFFRISFSLSVALATISSSETCIAGLVIAALATSVALLVASTDETKPSVRLKATYGFVCAGVLGACLLAAALGGSFIPVSGETASHAPFVEAVSVLPFVAVGSGIMVQLAGWLQTYARVTPEQTLVYIASSFALGNLFRPFLIVWTDLAFLSGFSVCCLAGSSALLFSVSRRSPNLQPCWRATVGAVGAEQNRTDKTGEPDDPKGDWSLTETVKASINFVTVGFALFFFADGVMALPPEKYANAHSIGIPMAATLLATALSFAFIPLLRKDARYDAVHDRLFFLLPIFATFGAFFAFIRMLDANGAVKNALALSGDTSDACLKTMALFLISLKCRERGISIERLVSPVLILSSLLYVAGIASYAALQEQAMYVFLVICMLYILALSLAAARRATLNTGARIEKNCAAVADAFELSSREAEILRLFASEYPISAIAEQLYISPETVKTHRKRIYAKTGVHKQEELLRLVRNASKTSLPHGAGNGPRG